MLSAEAYQVLKDDKNHIDQIIAKFTDGKHDLRPELQAIHEIGVDLIQLIQQGLSDSRFELQRLVRPWYHLMGTSVLFHSTDQLASPDDVPRLLGFRDTDDATTSLQQRLADYFQANEEIDYNPRSYYFYDTDGAQVVHFQVISIGELLVVYHDIVSVIKNTDVNDIVDLKPFDPSPAHEQLDSDVYVMELVIEHHKSHLYHLSESKMRAVLDVGKQLQLLADSSNPQILSGLDSIVRSIFKLQRNGLSDPQIMSDIKAPSHPSDHDGHYVRVQDHTSHLSIELLLKKYQWIVQDIFHSSRM